MGRKSMETLGRAADRQAGRGRGRRRRRWTRLPLWTGLGLLTALLTWAIVQANVGGSGEPVPVEAEDPVLGQASAPVTVVEYGDYKCPFCARFFTQTEPQLREQYIDPGQVRLVWRDFPNIDSESRPAAVAARCAGDQGEFWPYHDALYSFVWENFYGQGVNVEGGSAFEGKYEDLARQVGLDVEEFRSCRESGRYEEVVQSSRESGVSRGVQGTPTFFVNGQKIAGAQPLGVFSRLIDAELGR